MQCLGNICKTEKVLDIATLLYAPSLVLTNICSISFAPPCTLDHTPRRVGSVGDSCLFVFLAVRGEAPSSLLGGSSPCGG